MTAILQSPPRHVCLLRLSAIGDTCHALAVLRNLQAAWPHTRFTWIIGQAEARLMGLATDIEVIPFDKRGGLAEYRRIWRLLAGRQFDALLHMQLAIRASALALGVRAPVKLGFDRARAREGQWLFVTHRIAAREQEHVLDSMFGFAEALGVHDRQLRWNLPLPPDAMDYANAVIPDARPTLVISPCSSHVLRNWRAEYYAQVADHAVRIHRMRVVIAGSPAPVERQMAGDILRLAKGPLVDMVGRDTLPQLLGLLARAQAVLTPDSGPAHMATMVGTPVLGLYAATNAERSGPYLSRRWCVNRYPEAARQFLGRDPADLPWTTKIERPGVMDLIRPEDVTERLDALAQAGFATGVPSVRRPLTSPAPEPRP
jgi:heptosyltransferase I